LQDAFDDRPLAQLLQQEGLGPALQEVVLHGIAMCSTPQAGSGAAAIMTAAEGRAALQLFTASMGRFGGRGAFMAAAYGSGSLVEAFVRNAAGGWARRGEGGGGCIGGQA
jgi:hypothetical protein